MPATPDRHPGPSDEEGVIFEVASAPTVNGELRYTGSGFLFRHADANVDLLAGGGMSEAQHQALRHLIHFIDDGPAEGFDTGAYREIIGGVFPTEIIWWNQAPAQGPQVRIVDKTITRSGGGATTIAPTPIVWRVYNTVGSVIATVSDAITYSGAFETERTRTITV